MNLFISSGVTPAGTSASCAHAAKYIVNHWQCVRA